VFLRLSQRSFAGGTSPSLKGKCPGTPFGGFPDTHVPLIPTAKRYSLPSGLVQTSFLTNVRHERLFAIGKRSLSPWANTIALCAVCNHVPNHLTMIDHMPTLPNDN